MELSSEALLNHLYYAKLPQVYRDADRELNYPLKRYLSALIEDGCEEIVKGTNELLTLVDPEKCPKEYLPLLCRSFGLTYFEDIDDSYQRKFLMNIGEIVRRRGTYSCVRFLVRVLTGMNVEMMYFRGEYGDLSGRHLIITLLADTLDTLMNIETSIKVVERYVQSQLPYYIFPHVDSRIATQDLIRPVYRANVMTKFIAYDLRG